MRSVTASVLILGLAACSRGGSEPAKDTGKIACALAGSAQFEQRCWVETVVEKGRKLLIVRAPDGSFRRFVAVDDGRGAIPADGADDSSAEWVDGGKLQLTVGQDRYQFPASMKSDDAAKP